MTKSPPVATTNICGLIMPISALDGCNEQHWQDVKEIISSAVENAGFLPNLVSYADDVGIIQKRIIQNLYQNPIVVCDVSGKNPNVMFELGLRLAFDKPTIIIKDNTTSYSFDTSPIEHLEYPRDLRFNKIIEFKESLGEKIKATYDKSIKDPDYTTFLKHFGAFTAAKIETKEVSKEDFIIEELKELKKSVERQEMFRRNEVACVKHKKYDDFINKKSDWSNKSIYNELVDLSFMNCIKDKINDSVTREKFIKYYLNDKDRCKSFDEENIMKSVDDFMLEENKNN